MAKEKAIRRMQIATSEQRRDGGEEEDEDESDIVESEVGDAVNPMKVEKDKGFDAFETVRLIRGDLEDIYEYIESLRHDKDIVSNMAQRMAASNGKPKG